MHSILIVDDEDYVLKSLTRALRSEGYSISCFSDSREALAQCSSREFDLILSDQRMPGMLGTEFFAKVSQEYPATRRILISGYSDFGNVTDAFNEGIIHKFVVKPWHNKQLKDLIRQQLRQREAGTPQLQPTSLTPEAAVRRHGCEQAYHGIVTRDSAMQQQLAIIRRTAASDAPFFIHGETGTGKELIARAIHRESDRSEQPFVALNCANLTESLLESQLFGHRKGAFTGADKDQAGLLAEAEGGTLFLDEVTEIPQPLQAKLLRVLQEREYTPVGATRPIAFDVKLVSASALSLEKAVEEGRFREDLRYRLEVMPIHLPPLRARSDDKRLLFDYFLANQLQRHGRGRLEIDESVYDCVSSYHWPGNVREMVNVCTYVAALSAPEDDRIELGNLPPFVHAQHVSTGESEQFNQRQIVDASPVVARRTISRASLEKALVEFAGHRESIADHFGISRMTLWRKMKQFDLVQ